MKKNIFIFTIILLCATQNFAQNIDSSNVYIQTANAHFSQQKTGMAYNSLVHAMRGEDAKNKYFVSICNKINSIDSAGMRIPDKEREELVQNILYTLNLLSTDKRVNARFFCFDLHNKLGIIYGQYNKSALSNEYHTLSLKEILNLVQTDTLNADYQHRLANAYANNTIVMTAKKRLDTALLYSKKISAIGDKLMLQYPKKENYITHAIIGRTTAGDSFFWLGQLDSALYCYQSTLKILEAAMSKFPNNLYIRKKYPIINDRIAFVLMPNIAQQEIALKYIHKSIDSYLYLLRIDSTDAYTQKNLAFSYSQLADITARSNKINNDAPQHYQKSINLFNQLWSYDKKNLEINGALFMVYNNLIEYYLNTFNKNKEASEYIKKSYFITQNMYALDSINPTNIYYHSIATIRMGDIYSTGYRRSKDSISKALFYYKKGLVLAEKSQNNQAVGTSYNHIISIILENQDTTNLLNYCKKELTAMEVLLQTAPQNIQYQINIGAAYAHFAEYYILKKNYTASLSYYSKALRIFADLNNQNPDEIEVIKAIRTAEQRIGTLYIAEEKYETAANYLKKAIDYEKSIFFTKASSINESETAYYLYELDILYKEYYKLFPLKGISKDLYTNTLHLKNFLLQNTKNVEISLKESNDTIIATKLKTLKAIRYALLNEDELKKNGKLKQYQLEAIALETDLNTLSTTFRDRNKWWQSTYRDVQTALLPHEAAIEIITFPDAKDTTKTHYAALILTKNSKEPKMVMLPTNGKEMEGKYLKSYTENKRNKQTLQKAYAIYWQPIADALGDDIKTVWLAPEGVYHRLSIGTLCIADKGKDNGQYLAEKLDIRTVMTTRAVIDVPRLSAGGATNHTIALFGDPDYYAISSDSSQANQLIKSTAMATAAESRRTLREGDETLPRLEYTKQEVNTIDSLLKAKGWKTTPFLAEKATESQLKQLVIPTVLHIATHGNYDASEGQNPLLYAKLYLAGAANTLEAKDKPNYTPSHEDGILNGMEASLLNLQGCDLVVLSACETGLGDVRSNEGVYGFSRAFRMAGARAVLMSLWKVDDKGTSELMQRFYKKWSDGGLSKRAAFNAAQREMIREQDAKGNPKWSANEWGAFVLVE